MLLLARETIARALENVHFQLHLSIFLLSVLDPVAVQIERVLDLLRADIVLFELAALDLELALGGVELFALLVDLGLVLGLGRLQNCDLVGALLKPFVQHLDVLLGVVKVLEDALVASFKVTVRRVHIVQLAFEL